MDEVLVNELESAIADTGALLVRVQKYRRGAGPEGAVLGREALALGDAARRLHRRESLDAASAARLLAEARALAARLGALLASVRSSAEYQGALAAYAAGDREGLGRLLPVVFAGLETVTVPDELFAPVAWLRRGRLRPVAETVEDILAARDPGLPAEGDDLSPGADAALPAVVLAAKPPDDEPVVLRLPAGSVTGPVHRLADSGELLVHVPRLAVPALAVRLADRLAVDEQLRVEIAPADWDRYRGSLVAALEAARVPVET